MKRELYMRNLPNWLVADIARKHPEVWTLAAIKERAQMIAGWAVSERWDLAGLLKRLPGGRA